MADFPEREQFEAEMARAVAAAEREMLDRLLNMLGDPPKLGDIDPSFFDVYAATVQNAILPLLEKTYLQAAQNMLGDLPVGVDWGLVNEAAASWARSYGFELVKGVTDTTRAALQEKVGMAFEQGLSLKEVKDSLTSLFGPVRAEMIAVTEITRAAVEGERGIAAELAKQGIAMRHIFRTNNDEHVCPLCEPRNGKVINDGAFPPLHVRCRCFISSELSKQN